MSASEHLLITFPLGRRVDVRVRGHVIHTDQPDDRGGTDSAPTPYELFLAAIGASAGYYIHRFCAARELPTGGIAMREVARYAPDGTFDSIRFVIDLPSSFPAEYRDELLAAVERSLVKMAIAAGPAITFELQPDREPARYGVAG